MGRKHGLGILGVVVGAMCGITCGSFSGSDTAPDADAAAGSADSATAEAGTTPVIRGFSKVNASPSYDAGTILIPRPSAARKGDLLVLLTSTRGAAPPETTPPFLLEDHIGECPRSDAYWFGYGTRVDDETPTYSVSFGGKEFFSMDVIVVAIGNAGTPDDHRFVTYGDAGVSSQSGAAPAVNVTHARDLVLAAFSQQANPAVVFSNDADMGMTLETSSATMAVYQGHFSMGVTPELGPFSSTRPACWGALTIAIPPLAD